MKIIEQPWYFFTGDVLDPHDINNVWKYKQEALADAAGRRYIESVFPVSFVKDAATGYTFSDNADVLTFSFTAPADMYVTRAFLNGVFSVQDDDVKITIVENVSGDTPTGCTDPWLSVLSGATLNEEVRDFSAARFKLVAGDRYDILLSSDGNFTVERLDVSFHVLSDRFGFDSANLPNFQPTLVNELSSLSESVQDINESNFATEVGKLVESNYAPVCFTAHNFTVSTVIANEFKFPLPRIWDQRAAPVIHSIDFQLKLTAASAGTYTASIVDAGGGPISSGVSIVTTSNTAGYASAVINQSINSSSSNDVVSGSSDYFVVVKRTTSSAFIEKAFVTLWIK